MVAPIPNVFHVTYEDPCWCLWRSGGPSEPTAFVRKEDAVRVGTEQAEAEAPSQLVVYNIAGGVDLQRKFDPSDPSSSGKRSSEYSLVRDRVASD